jgi:DNA-binding SARP family transcriptional activator
MLLLARNRVVSRDRLIEGLWGASPPPTAAATLDTYISRLRRALRGVEDTARLVTEPPGYRLRLEAGELDLEHVETLLDRARTTRASGDARAAARDLREALALFRGTPLEDLVHAPFAQAEIGPLEELRFVALERRIEADLADGRAAELVGELEMLTARNPFRETLWAELMLALYRAGRQVEALDAFERARKILVEQFGLEPGQELKQLQSQILRQELSAEPGEPVRVAAAAATPSDEPAHGPGAGPERPRSAPVRAPPQAPRGPPPAREEDRALRRSVRSARWPAALAVTTILAAALAALVMPRVVGDGEEARGEYRLGTVLIDLSTGDQIESIPLSRLPVSAYPVFAGGHFWVNNWSPFEYVEIDAKNGRILRSINPPARDPNVHEEGSSITPFAVAGDVLWSHRRTIS